MHGGATAKVSGVTIRNGMTPKGTDNQNGGGDGEDGGGIRNDGNLTLLDCSVVANRTGSGGNGLGAIPSSSGAGVAVVDGRRHREHQRVDTHSQPGSEQWHRGWWPRRRVS